MEFSELKSKLPPRPSLYTDLAEHQIRILTLQPAGDRNDDIHCLMTPVEISWIDRTFKNSYEALSYAWGSIPVQCPTPIFINGLPKLVTESLDAALRALRGTKPRALWADALCINQDDNNEKSKQIPMMGKIYSKAKGVAIWLGEAEGDSDLAMATLANIRSENDLKKLSAEANQAIGNLFQRSWFSRVWTVQEFSLGKHPIFHCGQKSFSWSHIQDVLDHLIPNQPLIAKTQR
ncbi:HET-domain-containing protein [Stipitochalara longipes BDJ]|nr:HET-domain-containing protein [Stipitochalara longipes BDJ]